jgi:hypothetical protein
MAYGGMVKERKQGHKTRLIISLTDALERALNDHHVKTGAPKAEIVRRALAAYLKTGK